MKSQKIKNKALELYITNVPIYKIAKQLHTDKTTIIRWRKDNNWDKIKEEAIQKSIENTTEDLIQGQTIIAQCATKILAGRLLNEEGKIKTPELVSIMKHGLEVVRPRQTTNNLNITKNETSNTSYQIIIPKEVEELLNESIRVNT